jgi:4-hydroxy-2-oxoheptanedioate aldolase
MRFKERLQAGQVLRGFVNVIPSAVATQAMAAAGADAIMIDREHGPIGRESLHAMIAATAASDCAPIVRVPETSESEVKLALDAGAEGIVFPLVRTAEDAGRCVELVSYPPAGRRGWGPFVAHARWNVPLSEYVEIASHIACCLLIETVEAVANIDAILAVPGIDCAIVAQFDLTTDLGLHGQFDAPEYLRAVRVIEEAARVRNIPLGAAALSAEQSRSLIGDGYQLLFHGFDALILGSAVVQACAWG